MAVPSSGELKLWDAIWNSEIGGTKGDNSLHSASIYAGFSTPDAMGDFYGWSDVEAPQVSTQALTSIGTTSMTANGNVTDTGNENPTRGFYFGQSSNRTSNTKYTIGTGGAGAFSRGMTGLSQLNNYYCWAFAENSAGEANGSRVQAQTTEQSYSATFSTFGEGYAGITANIDYPGGFNGIGITMNQTWVNPYSSNLNSIASHAQSTAGTERHNGGPNAPGGIAINAATRWSMTNNRAREFQATMGSPNPGYFWLVGPTSQGQSEQIQFQSTRTPGASCIISGQFGNNIFGGNSQPGGSTSNNSQISWTFNLANPRSNGPHSRQF